VDDKAFYQEIVDWLKDRGHSDHEIDKILDRVRQYEKETQVDSLMDSYASGGLTLAEIIEEALRE
jgi:hypothetical protein